MRKLAAKASKPSWYVREWLAYKGMKQSDLVERTDHNKSEISLWVNGKRRFNTDVLEEFAKIIGVEPADLLRPPTAGKANEAVFVGKVGAGAVITRIDEGAHLGGVDKPGSWSGPNMAEIEGDSQWPLRDRWRVFYGPEHQGISEKCLGMLCVVQTEDGRTLLKTLLRGSKKGLWRLESWNAPPMDDERLVWAALVTDIQPR